MPFGPEPFGNELKAELLTAEGLISDCGMENTWLVASDER